MATYQIDYSRVLNPAQLEAVSCAKGPILVIAGAGSGKTRTLTYRVARLVEDGVPPGSILLLSFTRKASQEMIKRASQLLDHRCQQVSGGTFHSFANITLRRYARAIDLDNDFTILDRADSEDLIGMIRGDLVFGHEDRDLPRKATLASIFGRAVNKCLSLKEIIYEDYPRFSAQLGAIQEIFDLYGKRKREHGFCDYDDLLIYLHRLLADNAAIRDRLTDRYRYIMVDEYQDTNKIQAEIVWLLAGPDRNVMVVGDDSQSIYSFRGANFQNIIRFPERFDGTRIIKLEENYRSRQPILDLTNALNDQATEKFSKYLFTRRGGGRTPLLMATPTENAQSRYIVNQILSLRREGVPLDQIAVLFRASYHAFDLELELTRTGLPFVKYGGFKFAESAHIKDMLAHLRIFASPRDRISWYRVLLLVDKVGPKSANRIYGAVADGNGAAALLKPDSKRDRIAGLRPLKDLIAAVGDGSLNVVRLGELVLEYYLPILKRTYDDSHRRLRDLEQLLTIMQRYRSLKSFLDDMVLEPPNASGGEGRLSAVPENNGMALTLSTVHSAKGLEWHTVFVIWALDGRFPSQQAIARREDLEEELRLMYVATTRARENLHISYPSQAYDRATSTFLCRPSRFLEDLPEDLLERHYYTSTPE